MPINHNINYDINLGKPEYQPKLYCSSHGRLYYDNRINSNKQCLNPLNKAKLHYHGALHLLHNARLSLCYPHLSIADDYDILQSLN